MIVVVYPVLVIVFGVERIRSSSLSFPSLYTTPDLQINVANVDANGVYTQGDFKTLALAGYIRAKGEADSAFTELAKKADSEM